MDLLVAADYTCPWCGEWISTTVDTSQGDYSTVEDCSVCCRPISLNVRCEPGEVYGVEAERG
jgi:hypothetical protein